MDERILGLLKEARRQLEVERQRRSEPIAIVGIGCRFPGGASSPEELWQLLIDGVDATREVPGDRWDAERLYDADPDAPGKSYVKRGAFLEQIDGFDPEFFGISPREARGMDPQQRLLLEVTWEALEDAGIPPDDLRGSATGVWVGLCVDDYAHRSVAGDGSHIDAYSALGNARSIAAGRVSYVLDLRGPSVQLDTACSSSLVAVHQACQSLRLGECNAALVAGVNVMSAAQSMIALCKLRALAPDGRCKTFDASADGYGRGEGCGVVVLKRLSDAQAGGDRIYAVVRGSAVNHDGRSNGLTAPNGLAQEAIIRSALASAALTPASVDYVEAHGTGTALGDPIEVLALSRVYGEQRGAAAPLYIGAVKSNLGHLEGAAGVAGLIKVALCLTHSKIARQLHFSQPNPRIPWERLPVRIPTEAVDWPRNGKPRIAGVSSFGLSGTNAHALIEEAPALEPVSAAPPRAAELIVLTARTPAALSMVASRLGKHVADHPEHVLGDLAFSLASTRGALEHRLAFAVSSTAELADALRLAAAGSTPPGAVHGGTRDARGELAWLFTGQGAQHLGMGRALYEQWPAFRHALERAFEALDPLLERRLESVIWAAAGSPDAALLDQTAFTQPALFAVEWALAQLWLSWGAQPQFLAGHSIGEITAATIAGVFSLEDAARLVAARGRLMQALPAGGAMVSIAAAEADVARALSAHAGNVSIAAVNGPASTVVSGVERDVLAIAEDFAARGSAIKRLTVSHAFHSPLMEPMLDAFRRVVTTLRFDPPSIPLVSGVSGALATGEIATPEYWVRHVREAVRFAGCVQSLHAAGARTFIELGPRPTLLALVAASTASEGVFLLPSLRPGRPEPLAILDAAASWVAHGGTLDARRFFSSGSRRLPLPAYPWQRQRFWQDEPALSAATRGESFAVRLERLVDRGLLAANTAALLPELISALAKDEQLDSSVAASTYELAWQPFQPQASSARGSWGLIGDEEATRKLAAALEAIGVAVHHLSDLDALHAALSTGLEGVVQLLGAEEASPSAALKVAQAVASFDSPPRLWWVTRGAVGAGAAPSNPRQATVWGLARTFALEQPQAWGGIVDCAQHSISELEAERLASVLLNDQREDQVALRGSSTLAPRLRKARRAAGPLGLSLGGTILITGGLGALGLHVARWLARRGARNLLLVSRQGAAAPGAAEAVQQLSADGARVTLATASVSDRDAMASVLARIPEDAPLTAIFHVAGIDDRTPIAELTSERLERVIAPKREGTTILDELTRGLPLEAFVCFSSISAVWGAGRQAAYSAANSFLEAWAEAARAEGRRAFSIAWGPWSEGGMGDADSLAQLARRGLAALAPPLGLAALEQVLGAGPSNTILAQVDWRLFRQAFEAWGQRSFLEGMEGAEASASPVGATPILLARLLQLSPNDRKARLQSWLVEQCASILGLANPASLDPRKGFFDLGFDSLMAIGLRQRVELALGLVVSTTAVFSYPNIEALAAYLLQRLEPAAISPSAPAPAEERGAEPANTLESEEDLIRFINAKFEAEEQA